MFRAQKPAADKKINPTGPAHGPADEALTSAPPVASNQAPASSTPSSSVDRDSFASKIKDGSLGFAGDVIKIAGEIHFRSMLRIDGEFSGQISSREGTLIISSGGQVTDAKIDVAVAMVNGTVNGDITASRQLVLGRTADVKGNVLTSALVVEEGALFNGSCRKT